ncbi:unnamed protein product [Oikopleura dioica]|uniref:Uncharacterized protein n=1 Tax=Oikopleura dioica TaxID=34765 RepID=E4YS24_OIKDI|nr:unnamed protein product [Oikopleura dioica]
MSQFLIRKLHSNAIFETATTQISQLKAKDVFILVIPYLVDKSYLQSGDGLSQTSATINTPENEIFIAAHALVNGNCTFLEEHLIAERSRNWTTVHSQKLVHKDSS